jgi:YegS/Rv2252/BmrU family lipid kinase
VQVLESEHEGHAIVLSRDVAPHVDCIVAVGGDGTLNEVMNGCLQAGAPPPRIGVIARGTANDFTRSVHLRGTLEEVIELLRRGEERPADVGLLRWTDETGVERQRHFINEADIGFSAFVARLVNRRRRLPLPGLTYLLAILQGFLFYHKPTLRLATDEGFDWEGRSLACVIGNGRAFGSGLYATPGAHIDDGVFQCGIIGDVTLLDFVHYLPKLRRAQVINHPEVHYATATRVRVTTENAIDIDVDGECLRGRDIRVSILPGAITLLAPPRAGRT